MVCCFTGHRQIEANKRNRLYDFLVSVITQLKNQGYTEFRTGGALGFDTLAAKAVLEVQKSAPQIQLVLMLPCREQTAKWEATDKDIYEKIRRKATREIYVSEHYFNGCMQKRNRRLVQGSDLCICYLQKPTGGTAYTVRFAQSQGVEVFHTEDIFEV